MKDAASLIADNLDIWTGAIERQNSAGRGRSKKFSLYGIEKLRALILDLAVRGKLVPQDFNDEPASVLVRKIEEQKAKLATGQTGKLNKPVSSLPSWPFRIPETWEWCQIGNITNYGVTEKVNPGTLDSGAWVLELEDIEKGTSRIIQRVHHSDRQFRSQKNRFSQNDVLYGKLRPYLNKVIVADAPGVCTTEIVPFRGYFGLLPTYLRLFLKTPFFVETANNASHGMNLPRLSTDKARAMPIALPPLAEQQRIVAKVDELMTLCDALEVETYDAIAAHQLLVEQLLAILTNSQDAEELAENWKRLETHFDTLFTTEASVDQLKQTILQLAVMGKLVPQDPTDEPASELLKRIEREKVLLASEGSIRKPRSSPTVTKGEKPFALPAGWTWARFADLAAEVSTGPFGSILHKSDYIEGGVPVVNPSHMIGGQIVEDESTSISPDLASGKLYSYALKDGDLVFARRGEVGRVAVVTNREEGWICGTGSFRARFSGSELQSYLLVFFRARYARSYLGGAAIGATMANLNHGILNKLPVALPPADEQKRIVARVKELAALCDALKCSLTDAGDLRIQLADAIVVRARR